ncbi:AI-2E family transporter [Nodosilinea sp. E11]|uniref:AI-2E family transporter n=1 Tax=Nodosilinea sp. E11 TaxID=3037479 RepID=UPI002934BA22|nr:AI-2E family transporter [Nodosilinea sp. E11]WOD40466.1 AI-2E family transporter [Nodosilinea sp. E11]
MEYGAAPSDEPITTSWLARWWDGLSPMAQSTLVLLATPLLLLNVWAASIIFGYFRSILVTVLIAALLAFLLSYPMARLERLGLKRGQAAILVLALALVSFSALAITVLPFVIDQGQQLVVRLPDWFDSGKTQLIVLDGKLTEWGWPINLDGLISQTSDRLKREIQSIAGEALNLTLNVAVFTANKLLDVVLTIVLTFYLLQHGEEVWGGVVGLLPHRIQRPFSDTLRQSFRNYFLGQFIVASCFGTALTIIFGLLNVPFGSLFGLTVGLLALVPFGGTVGVIIVTLLVALRDIKIAIPMLVAAVVVQQLVETGIAPRVLGSVTGLNPFWVFIAILSGARVGGLLGVIVAVPAAVIIKEALVALRNARQLPPAPEATVTTEPTQSKAAALP